MELLVISAFGSPDLNRRYTKTKKGGMIIIMKTYSRHNQCRHLGDYGILLLLFYGHRFHSFLSLLFPLAGISRVELGQGAGRDTLEHLFGEDAEELPANVQRLEHGTVLIVALRDKVLLEFRQELQVEEIVRSQRFLSHHGLHGLHVFADGIASVLHTKRVALEREFREAYQVSI